MNTTPNTELREWIDTWRAEAATLRSHGVNTDRAAGMEILIEDLAETIGYDPIE